MHSDNYKGRFAPSPTGQVHYGTLVAAVGSYLQARSNNGQWFIRIDDVDTTRVVDGATDNILHTLEHFGFEWDGDISYQTNQIDSYQQALDELISRSLVFPCLCSRKQLAATASSVYPGTCRHRSLPEKEDHALRILANDVTINFTDIVMGKQTQNIKRQCGDFIIKRRDGLFAYQLAVVVDDAMQGITEIVRGADLLESTPRQIYLQQLLNFSTPEYCHLPLATDERGHKISKSEGASKVTTKDKEKLLVSALSFLGQQPPTELTESHVSDIWSWAIKHWNVTTVPDAKHVTQG